jgi:FkbM family methyltransferase
LSPLSYQPGVRQLLALEVPRLLRPSFWRHWDNPMLGRWVELRGNPARIDGCTFTLDSPAIPTGLKALFLFDRYERAERDALRRFLDPDVPVVELGGSLGVVACLTNRRLRDPSRHVVVEANAQMLGVLEENRARNGCGFVVMHRALAYGAPTVAFHQDDDFLAGTVLEGRMVYEGRPRRAVQVPTVRLRDILDAHGFARCTLVCDIEGAEVDLVAHELDVLRERVGTIIVETHPGAVGEATVRAMLDQLAGVGFRRLAEDAETVILRHNSASAA